MMSWSLSWSLSLTAASALKGGCPLERLRLSDCRIRDAGATAIAGALAGAALTELDLSRNPIGQLGLRAILTVGGACWG
jgi:hypothetical protein